MTAIRDGRSKSVCHCLPARLKLALALGVITLGALLPLSRWPAFGVLLTLVFAGQSLARIPLTYLWRRLALFLPLAALLAVAFPLAQGFRSGGEMAAAILLRSTLAFLAVLWLVHVLPFDQLLATLRRTWVPAPFVAMLALMHRYLFVLWDEMDRMRVARRARTFGEAGLGFRWKTSVQIIGMLSIRGLERAERVHGAMQARGWDGRVRSLD